VSDEPVCSTSTTRLRTSHPSKAGGTAYNDFEAFVADLAEA
jgi:hypothetical protein